MVLSFQKKEFSLLRKLTGKKHRQTKRQRLQKVRIWAFGSLLYQINSLYEVLKLKQNLQETKQLLAKLRSLRQVHFILTILFVLILASDIAVLNGNDAFSILVFSTKRLYPSFLKKIFVLKICFEGKVLKTLKIFTDCPIKTCRSRKQRTILKIPSTVLQKNLCL